jgi:TetR/AcrR family transcriptional regulator, cholesterol catabolism regulator
MPRVRSVEKFDRKLGDILAAAAQVFAEEGYDRASIRGVAERAQVSIAGLYYYIRSKEELLYQIQEDVFGSLVERFKAESQDAASPEARLELLVRNHLERFLANMAVLTVCSRELDRLEGECRTRIEAIRREYFGLAVRVFEEIGRTRGAGAVDARTAALAMFGAINWVHTWYRAEANPDAASLAHQFVQLFLTGVLPRS